MNIKMRAQRRLLHEVKKGETPWKLNVGAEMKIRANLVSSVRAQVNFKIRVQGKLPHKVEKGETPLKLKVGAEKKMWEKLGISRQDQEITQGMGTTEGQTEMRREYV